MKLIRRLAMLLAIAKNPRALPHLRHGMEVIKNCEAVDANREIERRDRLNHPERYVCK